MNVAPFPDQRQTSASPTERQVEDRGRLRVLPEAARRADEEPGPDQADGIDRVRRPARDLLAGRADGADRTPSSTRSCRRPRCRRPSALIGREITSADGTITGIVKEVKLYSDGVVAVLEGGKEITVGAGVVIRDRPTERHERGRRARHRPVRHLDRADASGPAVAVGHGRRRRHRARPGADAGPGNHADLRAEDRRDPAGRRLLRPLHRRARSPPSPTSSSSASKPASRLAGGRHAATAHPLRASLSR